MQKYLEVIKHLCVTSQTCSDSRQKKINKISVEFIFENVHSFNLKTKCTKLEKI